MPHASHSSPAQAPATSHQTAASDGDATHDLTARLSELMREAVDNHGAAPCLIARDLDSPVFEALLANLPMLNARGLTPLLLLGERPDPRRVPEGVLARVVTPDVASLLHEQAILGDWIWCGGAASARAPQATSPGRLFASLSATELRAFAIVFQGLWASGRAVSAPTTQQASAPRPRFRSVLAGGAR